MTNRWTLSTVLSLIMSSAALAIVVVFAFVSCTTPQEGPAEPQQPSQGPDAGLDTLRTLQSSFHRISNTVSPSVVRIDVREQLSEDPHEGLPYFDFFFGRPDGDEPVPPGFGRGGTGSGVIVSSTRREYFVLTNDHVVGDADVITVILNDGSEFDGELVGRDPRKDLAMVSFRSNSDLTVATLGDSDQLRVGDWVAAIGSPFGYQNTLTVGIVSALDRRGGPENNISDFIQTDASINQGNSGGALVNLDGEVIGINTWISSDTGGSVGLGFAIPINNVKRTMAEFLDDGDVSYGWLGVSIQTVDGAQADGLGLADRQGALVDSVFTESPAAESGLRAGDFIISVDGDEVEDSDELVLLVGEVAVGETLDLTIFRSGALQTVTATIAERDTNTSIRQSYRYLWPGFSVYPLTEEIAGRVSLGADAGVVVTSVDAGTAADIGGLLPFDVITAVNGAEVSDLISFYSFVTDPDLKRWEFVGFREDQEFEITVVR